MTDLTDLDQIRDRYAAERERRLRAAPDRHNRYLDHSDDPWQPRLERDALYDEVDVVVVGAGLSGLACAVHLRRAGVERIRLVDRAGDVGGTWYWNRYPAAQCDVESYIYLPFLEEMGYMPSAKYVYQPEILGYCQSIARKNELYADACFQTDVTEMTWSDGDARWTVHTDRGDAFRTQFVVVAGGFLQRPKLPEIPGIDEFRGAVFHSSRWDYTYTGGRPGPDGGQLDRLGKRTVGLVGTGASGLQLLTPLALAARHVYVFQRTPVVVLPRNNQPTDAEWFRGQQPGWQQARIEAFNRLGNSVVDEPDLVQDGWTQIVFPVMASHGAGLFGGAEERHRAELIDLKTMDEVRARVARTVADQQTAALLMPYFRMLCKRASFHDEYLQAYNRDNVTLVDASEGVERLTADAAVVGGREYRLDCLVLATGFDTARGALASWGMDFVGKGGLRLSDYWAQGMRTFQGTQIRHFPNLFLHSTTQAAGPPNYTSSALEIGEHIAYVIAQVRGRGCSRVEAGIEAEAAWVEMIESTVPEAYLEFFRSCTPGFYNNYGDIDGKLRRLGVNNYLGGSLRYYDMLRTWRADGGLAGLDLS